LATKAEALAIRITKAVKKNKT